MFKNKNILIAGGGGFIGTNLLLRWGKDNNITIIDNFSSSSTKEYIWNKFNNLTIIYGDITNSDDIAKLNKKYDIIVNLACMASPKYYQSNPIATMDTCYIGTKNLLSLLDNDTYFLQASTSEIYGDPTNDVQNEKYRGNVNCFGPRACYDEGKRIAETLCYEYIVKGFHVNVARIFNTYGPWMEVEDGRIISNVLTQLIKNEPITVYGDGSQTRSFQFVDDLIDGFEAAIKMDYGFPINLGNPSEFTINDLVDIAVKKWGYDGYPVIYQMLPTDDPKQRKPDIEMAKKLLNFNPKISLEEGLEITKKYFESVI